MKRHEALRISFQAMSEIAIIGHLADTALAKALPPELSVAGFGLVASHGVLHVAASDAARPDAIMSMAAPDCHGHATAPDDSPTPAQSKDFHVCSDMCCVILATALPPVTPFVAPPPVLAEAMIQPETLRRAPPAPPPRT